MAGIVFPMSKFGESKRGALNTIIATHHKINKDAFQGGADWQDSGRMPGVGENGEEFLGRTTRWKFAFRADGQIPLGQALAVFLGRGQCLLDEEAAWKRCSKLL